MKGLGVYYILSGCRVKHGSHTDVFPEHRSEPGCCFGDVLPVWFPPVAVGSAEKQTSVFILPSLSVLEARLQAEELSTDGKR